LKNIRNMIIGRIFLKFTKRVKHVRWTRRILV